MRVTINHTKDTKHWSWYKLETLNFFGFLFLNQSLTHSFINFIIWYTPKTASGLIVGMDRQDIHTNYEFDIDNDVNIPEGNNNTTILKQSNCYLEEPELKTKKGYPFMPTFSFTHPSIQGYTQDKSEFPWCLPVLYLFTNSN